MWYPFYIETPQVDATVDVLYKYCKDNNKVLFPTGSWDFWVPYANKSAYFDRFFYQKFKAFKVVEAYVEGTSIDDMLTDWKDLISAFFTINEKRYSELFRVECLDAQAYDIVNNYDLTEEITRENTGTVKDNLGSRQDGRQYTAVAVTMSSSQHEDSHIKGQIEEDYEHGAHTDGNSTTLGAQTSDSTQTRSAFNSTTLKDVQGGTIENGEREDSSEVTYGEYTDTKTTHGYTDRDNYGAKVDTNVTGSHSETATTGAQENTRTDNLKEETSLHRYGNIGVQTAAQVIGGHIDLWKTFRFYQMIFDEIADEYLRVNDIYGYVNNGAGSGGGSTEELMAAIQQLQEQVTALSQQETTATQNIRGDISTLSGKTTTEANRVIAAVTLQGGSLASDISTLSGKTTTEANRVIAAVTLQGASLHGDIVEVTTNGY